MIKLTKDEVYILGGVGITGILMGELERSKGLVVLLQQYRSDNAAGFVAEALYFLAQNKLDVAIDVLEQTRAMEMKKNYEQAISLYIDLLSRAGREQEAIEIAQEILGSGSMKDKNCLDVIKSVLNKV